MTDGSEEEYVGVGAVLYDPVSAKRGSDGYRSRQVEGC